MPASPPPGFEQLMGMLATISTRLAGGGGKQIRVHVERLAEILADTGPAGDAADPTRASPLGHDAALRARAATELDQLVTAVGQLAGAGRGATAQATRGIDLAALADGLRTFAVYLRAPTDEHQAQVERMVATLQGAAPQPVALDELKIDGRIEELALESARRNGLAGSELRRAVERMKRQMTSLVRQLEHRAEQEASRARTAAEAERLVDRVIQTGTPLGQALAAERAAIVGAFRSVDLAHMADGLRVFALWLSTPAGDAVAHVAVLRDRLAGALGPATAGDPARSEDERRADFEREIKVAIDQIFRGQGPASA